MEKNQNLLLDGTKGCGEELDFIAQFSSAKFTKFIFYSDKKKKYRYIQYTYIHQLLISLSKSVESEIYSILKNIFNEVFMLDSIIIAEVKEFDIINFEIKIRTHYYFMP